MQTNEHSNMVALVVLASGNDDFMTIVETVTRLKGNSELREFILITD